MVEASPRDAQGVTGSFFDSSRWLEAKAIVKGRIDFMHVNPGVMQTMLGPRERRDRTAALRPRRVAREPYYYSRLRGRQPRGGTRGELIARA